MNTSNTPVDGVHLDRTIGLGGAIALVVGAVVGAGIYVMVADIGALSGNALWLSFLAAMGISLVGTLPLIQLAGALPRNGAGWFFTSRMLSPFWGMIVSYLIILGGASSSCIVSLTMAKFALPALPAGTSMWPVALGIVVLFFGVYQLGVRLAMGLQVIMAAQLVVALAIYAVAGVAHGHLDFAFSGPRGVSGLLLAMVLSYTTCMGFQVVAELGEEIKDARRNIPLALLIGGGIVAVLYIIVGTVYVSSLPYESYTGANAKLATRPTLTTSGALFLPGWLNWFLALGAWSAGLTSLNAAAIAIPREWFAQSRDRVASAWIGMISPRTHTPQRAVMMYLVLVVCMLSGGALAEWTGVKAGIDVDFYGLMAAIGIQGTSAVLCMAGLALPRRYPVQYRAAYIVFPRWMLLGCAVLTGIFSMVFVAILAIEKPLVLVTYAVWIAGAIVAYKRRTARFGDADWARTASIE